MDSEKEILKLLKEKSCTKQKVYKITKGVFGEIQEILSLRRGRSCWCIDENGKWGCFYQQILPYS